MSPTVIGGLCHVADLLLLCLTSIAIFPLLSALPDGFEWGESALMTCVCLVVFRSMAKRRRLYTLAILMDPIGFVPRVSGCVAIAAAVGGLAVWLSHSFHMPASSAYLHPVAWFLGGTAVLLAFRSVVASVLAEQDRAGRLATRVAILGATGAGMRLMRDLERDKAFNAVGIFDDRMSRLSQGAARTWMRGDVDALVDFARTQPLDAIVITVPLQSAERLEELRRRLASLATDIFVTPDAGVYEVEGARFARLGGNTVLSIAQRPLRDWTAFKKDVFDRVAAAILLVLGLPLMAVIAVIVRLDSPGPVLFRQQREGLNGSLFTMLKFRTMVVRQADDEARQARRNDPRVTRSGRWLRRFSLDELPQLWNVLRGEMSLVGPRPHLPTTLAAGNRLLRDIAPHYDARHRMKPGVTGWAQVQGLRGETRTEQEVVDRIAQDLYYIENWSLGLDVKIILRTVLREIIRPSNGAY